MRIVLFTLNENRYTPLLLEPVLRRYESQIVAAYVSNRLNRLALIQWKRLWFFTRHLYPLSIQPGDLYRFLFQPRQPAVPMLTRLRERGIPAEYIDEIRSLRTRERLAAHDADLFLFCPFDRIAGPKFLSIPRLGTFNTHLGKRNTAVRSGHSGCFGTGTRRRAPRSIAPFLRWMPGSWFRRSGFRSRPRPWNS
jgi:hypothetical protein